MGFLGVLGVVLWIIQYPLYGYLIGLGQENGCGVRVAVGIAATHLVLVLLMIGILAQGYWRTESPKIGWAIRCRRYAAREFLFGELPRAHAHG
jgi:hypothetical protein